MKYKEHSPDYLFLSALIVLTILGLVFLLSASSVSSFKEYGDSYYKLKHQIYFGVLPGIFLFFLFYKINYQKTKKMAPILMFLSILSLVLVLIPGIGLKHGSARSWLGYGHFSFQPAEFVKLFFILYLSLWFANRKNKEIKKISSGFLPFLVYLGLVVGLIILQPDLGTAIVLMLIALSVYFLAGAKISHLILFILLGSLMAFLLFPYAKEYQKNRLIAFLNPQFEKNNISYHINQAFLAIGSGGMWGVGYGQSRQKFSYLPEVVGDSIFAIIAEEMGFIFSVLFLFLIFFIILRGFKIAKKSPDKFTYLAVSGIMSWVSFQSIINIGAMVGIMPLTGVTLPLVSYGGSSTIILGGAFGFVFNISKYVKK